MSLAGEFVIGFLVDVPVTAAVVGAVVARMHRNERETVMGGYSRVPEWRRAITAGVTPSRSATCCLHTPCSAECSRTQDAQHQTRYALGAIEALKNPDAVRDLVNKITKQTVYDVPADAGVTSIMAARKSGG
jgi:hypothetical protein